MLPSVHIIMPVYDTGERIRDTLKSLKNQTYPNWTVLIHDDGSTDAESLIILEKAVADNDLQDRVILTKSPKNEGNSMARTRLINQSLQLDPDAWFLFVDGDGDTIDPPHIAKGVAQMQSADADICLLNGVAHASVPALAGKARELNVELTQSGHIADSIYATPGQRVTVETCPHLAKFSYLNVMKLYNGKVKQNWVTPDPDHRTPDIGYMAALLDPNHVVTALPSTDTTYHYVLQPDSVSQYLKKSAESYRKSAKAFIAQSKVMLENLKLSNPFVRRAANIFLEHHGGNRFKQFAEAGRELTRPIADELSQDITLLKNRYLEPVAA